MQDVDFNLEDVDQEIMDEFDQLDTKLLMIEISTTTELKIEAANKVIQEYTSVGDTPSFVQTEEEYNIWSKDLFNQKKRTLVGSHQEKKDGVLVEVKKYKEEERKPTDPLPVELQRWTARHNNLKERFTYQTNNIKDLIPMSFSSFCKDADMVNVYATLRMLRKKSYSSLTHLLIIDAIRAEHPHLTDRIVEYKESLKENV